MARIKNKYRVALSGVSVNQLLNIGATELKGYDRDNLSRIVTKLNSAANKRLTRFEKEGYNTPAMRKNHVDKGERFSVNNKNLKQLRAEYIHVSSFLKDKTSTLKGYKSFLQTLKKKFNENGVKIGGDTEKEIQDFIDEETKIYDWLKERNPFIEESGYKYEAMLRVSEMVEQKNLSERAIKRRMNQWAKKVYKEEQRKNSIDTSNFIDITEDEE